MKKEIISLYVDTELIELIDKKRDGIPRSVFIEKILRKNIK